MSKGECIFTLGSEHEALQSCAWDDWHTGISVKNLLLFAFQEAIRTCVVCVGLRERYAVLFVVFSEFGLLMCIFASASHFVT